MTTTKALGMAEIARHITRTLHQGKPLIIDFAAPAIEPRRIFVSYAHPDRPFVDRLAGRLEHLGHNVWFDKDMHGGDNFRARINDELERADVVLTVWTQTSIASKWVVWESAQALDQNKLISLKDYSLDIKSIPPPFSIEQMLALDDTDSIAQAIQRTAKLG